MKKEKSKKHKIVVFSIWALAATAIIGSFAYLTNFANSWSRALGPYFGYIGQKEVNNEELTAKEKDVSLRIVDEGTVLLKNDNSALPLSKNSKVSVFGQTAYMWMTKEKLTNTVDTAFTESLANASLEVNPSLRKFYTRENPHTNWGIGANLGDGGIAGTWAIDETPQNEFTDDVKNSYVSYSDAAIIVFSRCGSEGGDLPRYMGRYGGNDNETYLELTKNEKDLLEAVKNSQIFKKTIVVIHSGNALQMDFADKEEYGINSILWISGTGKDGVEELGKIIVGDINPSGKNVDTYVTDNYSSPVMQNFGDYRFTKGGNLINATTSTVGGTYSYLNYGESIYMGYRYYETRYEDVVTQRNNVGNFDYSSIVYRPFGYGLSYSKFELSDFNCSYKENEGIISINVKITNTGDYDGKQVVQIYYQSPYTEYDSSNGIEKSSVNLIEFGKTELLKKKGGSQTLSFEIKVDDMASYDSSIAKSYLLEEGDYYLTAAFDAHEAINNILKEKGYSTSNGMTSEGSKSFVHKTKISATKKISKASTGYDITNQFEEAELDDASYLSRNNWKILDNFSKELLVGGISYSSGKMELGTSGDTHSSTMDAKGTVGIHEANDSVYTGLTHNGWDYSLNPTPINDASWKDVSYNSKSTSLKLENMINVSYENDLWDDLVNQMSLSEQIDIVGTAMGGTSAIDSVGKKATYYADGPQGMIDYISGGAGYQFPNEVTLGATWNKELAQEEGDLCSSEFAMKTASIWWSPAMNLHRSPFSGRNFEYFSEDSIHSGLMAVEIVKAAKDNGVACQLKHFFLNDQETNRGAQGRLATFAQEQVIRELYLKPFQICIEEGKAGGVMASMSRIGTICAPCNYNLMTNILRNEWGMKGAVITDAQSFTEDEMEQALAAGCDMVDQVSAMTYNPDLFNTPGGKYMLHNAAKNILYVTVNSIAVSSAYITGFPIYVVILIVAWAIIGIYLLYGTGEILLAEFPNQKIVSKRLKWIIRCILWTLAIAIITYLLIMFFTVWLEALRFALQTA